MDQPPIDILLATYNGGRFLDAQLDSLWAQTRSDFRLLVRDDGSTDATPAILAAHAADRADRVQVLTDGRGRLGPRDAFAALLAQSTSPWAMLCDQDDVWRSDHVERMAARMEGLEGRLGRQTPILVHSDLAVVDAELRPLAGSFWRFQGLNPRRGAALNRLVLQNVVTGCATMVNRALVRKALPLPPEAVMHDWWLAVVAAAAGRIARLDEPTVLYRQHQANQVGARRWGLGYILDRLVGPERGGIKAGLLAAQLQAGALARHLAGELDPATKDALSELAELSRRGFFGRRWVLLRHGFRKTGCLRNLGLFAAV